MSLQVADSSSVTEYIYLTARREGSVFKRTFTLMIHTRTYEETPFHTHTQMDHQLRE